MATHGQFGEFNPQREDWTSYTERLQEYFIANGLEDAAKKKAVLLSIVGAETYQLMRNLTAPAKPTEKSFDQLVKLVEEHHHPAPSVILQRFKFASRRQKPGESIATFVSELRRLSEHCNYGQTLDEMLRDRVVCGIADGRLQRRLLAEPELTLKKAVELAQAQETADQGAQHLQQKQPQSGQMNNLTKSLRPALQHGQTTCYRCRGTNHLATECRFKDAICRNCSKKGHIARACRSTPQLPRRQQTSGMPMMRKPPGQQPNSRRTHQIAVDSENASDTSDSYEMFNLSGTQGKPYFVNVQLNNCDLEMEIDTGASLSIMSEQTYHSLWQTQSRPELQPTTVKLHTYTKEPIKVLGIITVHVCYKEQNKSMPLLVVAGHGPSLLGRDWLAQLKLDWQELYQVNQSEHTLQTILDKHKAVFKDELGEAVGITAKLHVSTNTKPYFCRARPVPHSLRHKIEEELQRLQDQKVIEPVQMSEWAAPIVPVLKPDGTIRICGDYKITVNKVAKPDVYPLPRVEDLFATLAGGKTFTKLDLAHAYQQIPLEESSKQYVTINTHKGLYQYNRLPFGVAAAPSIFQRTLENLLQGIPHVSIYLDDILVTGTSEAEHLDTLDQVLNRLETAGLRLKQRKCAFMLESVIYLGHKISQKGLQPTEEKVRAITEASPPTNVSQLRSFLGLINYYGKFFPNLANMLAPLYSLLQKATRWSWGKPQQSAFQEAKTQLTSEKLLIHYDPSKELLLSCDASPYGIGAVLSHRMQDGTDQPIAFASRSLSKAEKGYAHLDKEGLAIVYGVKKFHQYLYGRKFTITSDHKPLEHIFSSTRPTPSLASARIQRWALTLSAYNYQIQYKPGKDNSNADALSRLPLPESPTSVPLPGETIFLMDTLETSPVNATQIRTWTSKDPVLSRVKELVLQGWIDTTDEQLQPYQRRKDELSIHAGCILLGSRVVVPPAGRQKIMEELHQGHPGITRVKGLARGFVWWPGMDLDLENMVKSCPNCQVNQKAPPVAPLHPWEWPQRPWTRLHIDYAGPFLGKMFLVTVDAYSKWIDAQVVSAATSYKTIEHLRTLFATHGIPTTVVSDNGTPFTSAEFAEFTTKNGIHHIKVSPYHPSSNGLAERAVRTLKEGLRKIGNSESIECLVARVLFHYRITPHSTTGVSPAELLMGRRIRSHLDLVRPNLADQVEAKQKTQKLYHDRHAKARVFNEGDPVFVRNTGSGSAWLSGNITKIRGPVSYTVKLNDGRLMRKHVDQIRFRTATVNEPTDDTLDDCLPPSSSTSSNNNPQNTSAETAPPPRRSTRIRHPPRRYADQYI